MVVPIEKGSPGLWLEDKVCKPELSVAVGAVQDMIPVASPPLVTLDWLVGHPLMTGLSTSDDNNDQVIKLVKRTLKMLRRIQSDKM